MKESYPIDAGGAVQFLTGIKEQSPSIVIGCSLCDITDRDRLRTAVKRAVDVFTVFKVKLALSDPGLVPVFESNNNDVDVYPYDEKPHAFGSESNGYLFRVYYSDNRVWLSIFHLLTDFSGAKEFLKCILCFYFDIAGGRPDDIRKLLDVDPGDRRDPYSMYGDIESGSFSLKDKWVNELMIPNRMLYRKGEKVTVHDIVFPIRNYLYLSKETATSVFALLSWLIGNAVARTYGGEDKLLTGSGSFNCRSMFDSQTPLCFSQTFITILHPNERHLDFNMQMNVHHARMHIELEEGTIKKSIAARKEQMDQRMQNARQFILDQKKLDAERRSAARKSTYFASYLGHLDLGEEVGRYIQEISVFNTVTRVPIVAIVYEWKGIMHCRILEIGCENSIANAILEIAKEKGITGKITAVFEKCFDSFPMEELYGGTEQ